MANPRKPKKTKSRTTPRRTVRAGARKRAAREERLAVSGAVEQWARDAKDAAVRQGLVSAHAQQRCHWVRIVESDGTVTYKYVCELVYS
jgi:hypothetical protein